MSQPKFKSNIELEELNAFPAVRFEGNLVVVDSPAKLEEVMPVFFEKKLWGFDTETKPSFKRGKSNKVSLIQISDEETCYLVRTHLAGLDNGLIKWMEDESIKKIGLSLKDDMRELNKLKQIKPKGFIDLQNIVGDFGISDLSLKKVSGIVLGKKISKKQRLTNWESSHLTEAQMRYAATDAWICLEIYDALMRSTVQ